MLNMNSSLHRAPRRAGPVTQALMRSLCFCGWCIRTIASGDARYNPISYSQRHGLTT